MNARKWSTLTQPAVGTTIWGVTFAIALALYAVTANRGAQWQDSGWQQVRIVTGQLEHPLGLALCHPLHYYLGRAVIHIPGIEPAFAITLISSLAGAIAAANVAATVLVLTRRTAAAVIAGAALVLSHTFWQHATHTESYALVAALLSGEWLCLALFATSARPRYLLLVGLLNGLGISTHLLAALATPVDIAVFAWAVATRRCSRRYACLAAAFWLVGTLPYSLLVLAMMMDTGDVGGTLHSALFGRFAGPVLNTALGLRMLALSAGYIAYNFPGLTVPLAFLGVYRTLTERFPARWLLKALLAELVICLLFVIRYAIVDQYSFFFPVYLLLAVFSGIGLAKVLEWRSRWSRRVVIGLAALSALWTPAVYLETCSILRSRGLFSSLVKNKPYRDGYRAFFVPWGRGADHASRLNAAARALADDRTLILVEDSMQMFGLRYAQLMDRLPQSAEIRLLRTDATDEQLAARRALVEKCFSAGRTILLVPADRDHPRAEVPGAHWERHGDIYRLNTLDSATTKTSIPP